MTDLTKITTPFGLLDEETQATLKAHGGPYEVYVASLELGRGVWKPIDPVWTDALAVRVKPGVLIPDSIDWSHVAKGFDWMARDPRGEVYVYKAPPKIARLWRSDNAEFRRIDDIIPSYRRGTVDWRDSLVRRPE